MATATAHKIAQVGVEGLVDVIFLTMTTGILATSCTPSLFDGYQYVWYGRKPPVSEPRNDRMDDATAAATTTTTPNSSLRPSINGSSQVDPSMTLSNNDNDDKNARSSKKQRKKTSHKSNKEPATTDGSSDEPRNESIDATAAAATVQLYSASMRASSKKKSAGETMKSKMTGADGDSNSRSSNKQQKKKLRNSKKKPPKDGSSDQQQQQQQQQQRIKKKHPNVHPAVSNKLKKILPPRTTQMVGDSMPLPMMPRPKKKNPSEKRKSLIAAHVCSHCLSVVGSCSLYKCKCCASTDPDDGHDDNTGLILCKGCCKSRFYGRCQECKSYLCHDCSFVGWEDPRTKRGHLVCDTCALAMGGEALWKTMLFK